MASFNYQEYQNLTKDNQESKQQTTNSNYIGYFNLKTDGEEAIVRFMYDSSAEFNIFTYHHLQVNDKRRKIDCLRNPHDPVDLCPLCASGNKAQRRFFIKLLQYIRQEDGSIKAVPKIWERSDVYATTLNNLFTEYGNISDCVFKVKRNGASGDVNTSYDIMFANPVVYKSEMYVKDTEAFKDFDFFKYIINQKSAEDMMSLVKPKATETQPAQPTQQPSQPTLTQTTSQTTYNQPNYTQPSYNPQPQQYDYNSNQPSDDMRPKRIYNY